jgi:hypothetical protein
VVVRANTRAAVTNDETHYAKGPQQSSSPHGYAATSVSASPYRWREEVPTVGGYWWCRFRSPYEHREGSHMLRITREILPGGVPFLFAYLGADPIAEVGKDALVGARWAGPIPEPIG